MSTPGGGTGMNFGDDYVAARLSIDIPQEGIQGVRELTEGIERFRTSMEAATRAEADMGRYLDQMAESSKRAAEAQANLTQQLSTYMSLNARMQGQGVSSGVPGGPMQQPWSGVSAGMGPITPGSRMPNPSDVVYQLNTAAARSPREYLNMQQARGNVPSTDAVNISPQSIAALADSIAAREKAMGQQASKTDGTTPPKSPPAHHVAQADPYDKFQQRATAATGLAGSIMNEVGSGSGAGFGHLALQGLNYARNRMAARSNANASSSGGGDPAAGDPNAAGGGDDGTGGLSGLTKGMGAAGGVLTAALGAFGLIQKGGTMVQGWRDIASPGGGAGGEGLRASMRARGLAISDPVLSSDQTRQIYQAMISEKYSDSSGSGGDDVRNLMIQAIKDWNMSVPEFVQASRLTAKFTQVSTAAFGDYMSEIRNQSKTGWLSQQDIRTGVVNTASQLQAQGVPRGQAMQAAMQSSQIFANDPTLAGGMMHGPSPSMNAYERMYGGMNVPPGLLPSNTSRFLGPKEQEARLNVLKSAPGGADWCKRQYRDTSGGDDPQDVNWQNATWAFWQFVQRVDPEGPWAQSQDTAADLYNKLAWSGATTKSIIAEQKQVHDQSTESQRQVGTRPSGYGGGGSEGGGGGRFRPTKSAYGSETLDNILGAYGNDASKVEVMTPNGPQKLDTGSKEQIEKLGSGEYKWRHKGDKGGGITLSDTPEDVGSGFSTDRPGVSGKGRAETSGIASTGPGGAGDQAKVQIDLSPDAKKLLQVMGPNPTPLSPNDIAANSGQGDAAVNNPPPGSRWGRGR